MIKGVLVKEVKSRDIEYQEVFYSDAQILELFPDSDESIVNKLLRRAQRAEQRCQELSEELKEKEYGRRTI